MDTCSKLAPFVQTLDSAIQRMTQLFPVIRIRWIVINPVDSAIQLLSNLGLVSLYTYVWTYHSQIELWTYVWNESGNDPRSWITRIISSFISLFAVQNTIHFIYSCHFHNRVYHELTTMAFSPVGLCSPMDRALRPVIVKVRVFQVLFQPPWLFIQLRGSFPLSHVYPQFKIWAVVSYIYIHMY